jgi:hypothetical protein
MRVRLQEQLRMLEQLSIRAGATDSMHGYLSSLKLEAPVRPALHSGK